MHTIGKHPNILWFRTTAVANLHATIILICPVCLWS